MKTLKKLLTLCFVALSMGSLVSCDNTPVPCSHSYDTWKVIIEATCEENGEMTRTCTICGYVEKRITIAKGHNYINGVCTVCGKHE